MSKIDYTIYYKRKIDDLNDLNKTNYDLFISVYNDSFRVNEVFKRIGSSEKHWLILPEYEYTQLELPAHPQTYQCSANCDESEIIRDYFDKLILKGFFNKRVCIDITGFMRQYIVFLIRYLAQKNVKKVDFLYTDPEMYVKSEDTSFSDLFLNVKQIIGCEGNHNPETYNDLLIIGAGYDNKRISDVAKNKANAKKVLLFGFPSLQPDMFQQNILNAYKAEESSHTGEFNYLDSNNSILAPANDPFVTAQLISEYIQKEDKKKEFTNIYLCPLSTKAQTLGFALYYIYEGINRPMSIIFPYFKKYTRETTRGFAKSWIYTVELNH
jgi:hypothetical protein